MEDSRSRHLELQGLDGNVLRLYKKPYSLDQARKLLFHAQNLKNKRVPNIRMKKLGASPGLGKVNATVECLKLMARLDTKEQRAAVREALAEFGCLENLPWSQLNREEQAYDTVLLDLVEISQFVAQTDSRNEEETHAA